jgi:D-3-phosphoglycerate dehydrogenase
VNTARGGIIDEAALASELRDGHLAGAAVDVMRNEPPEADNPLLNVKNIVLTPHMGGATDESAKEKSRRAAENIMSVYRGKLPSDTVNTQGLVETESVRGL